MPHNVEIEVFPIAKTQVDKEQVKKWIELLGVEDYQLPSDVSDPSLLVALSAKRCYKSFDVSLNKNLTKIRSDWTEYLDNVLKSGHGCYDSETDVLTSEGWKNWTEINGNEEFATLNQNTFELEYQKAIAVFLGKNYKGKMYWVDSPFVNLSVTPNHQMFVCKTTTKEGRKKQNYSLIKAEELENKPYAYLTRAKWRGKKQYFSDNEMKLIGFSIGDGSRVNKNIIFHLHRKRKITYLKKIAQLAGINVVQKKDKFIITIPNFDPKDMYDGKEKIIPKFLLKDSNNLSCLYDGLINSDGSVCDNVIVYDTTSRQLSDQFFELCLKIGSGCVLSQAQCYKDRKNSFGKKPVYRHTVVQKCFKPEVNKLKRYEQTGWKDFDGKVYCVEVPNHTLFVRRNGKPVWCGNSTLEHSVYTFAIEGISRVFTGEMNRHRAGVGISEGSMRFIRYDDIGWWMPLSIRPDPLIGGMLQGFYNTNQPLDSILYNPENIKKQEGGKELYEKYKDIFEYEWKKSVSRDIFRQSFQEMEDNYKHLCELWNIDKIPDFHTKKQLTSCFRRLIGMGVATGGVWTMNLRAVRHIISMRTTEAAEEEIAYVFSKIAKIMIENEPTLFSDFEQDDKGFYKPKYWKV